MSHYYGMGPWPTSWAASGDISTGYPGASAQYAGWSTSWDDITSDSARVPRKGDVSSQKGGSVNAALGFASDTPAPANSEAGLAKEAVAYHELLPGETWESVLPSAATHKPAFSHSTSPVLPTGPVALPKPAATAASYGWVEVTSSEGWTASAMPAGLTTPTKVRPKVESTPGSPSHGLVHSPSAPGLAGNNKRHRDIEDELGHQDRYKTELCRSWHESGACRYGTKCQFAHGAHELRPVMRHPKYKTEPCRSWVETRTCPYGRRCRFIHSDTAPGPTLGLQSGPNTAFPAAEHNSLTGPSSDYSPTQMHTMGSNPSMYAHMSHPYYPEHAQRAHSLPTVAPPPTGPTGHSIVPPPRFSESAYAHVQQHAYQPMQQHQQQVQMGQQNQYYPTTSTGLGFGMPMFNGSPPLSLNSREHIAMARASNAPWLSDTYQEDDTDEYDPLSESLPLTPLIEQLNLHAEPVSPTVPHVSGQQAATTISRPTPIGSAPNGARVAASSTVPSHASTDASSTDSTEKSKKKKSSRLNIFQRLSSK